MAKAETGNPLVLVSCFCCSSSDKVTVSSSTFPYSMLIQVLISSLLIFATTGLSANACPSEEAFPGAYSRREGGYCEGFLESVPVTSDRFRLVSLTSSVRSPLRGNLRIKIPNPLNEELSIVLGSAGDNYRIDGITMLSAENSYMLFNLPTRELRRNQISIDKLQAVAKSGPQTIYFPIILQEPVDKYSFVFYSLDKAKFTDAEIRLDGQPIYRWEQMPSAGRGEIVFEWIGPSVDSPEGLHEYEFHYTVNLEPTRGGSSSHNRSIAFMHNPAWLK